MVCRNCGVENADRAIHCANCGQMLATPTRPLSCWKMIIGGFIIMLFLPVGALGVFCTAVGMNELRSPGPSGATEILAFGFGMLVVGGLFTYLGWRVLTDR